MILYDNASGQALVMAVLMGAMLALTVPTIVFVNQINAAHQTGSEHRLKTLLIAREGIAYAKQLLAARWTAALAGPPWTAANGLADCNGGLLRGADGSLFKMTCDRDAPIEPYQVHVVVTAYAAKPDGAVVPLRALSAFLSPQTVAVNLPNDVRASVALELINAPAAGSHFTVHWGPISCLDPSNLVDLIATPMDAGRFPRKFFVNGLNTKAPARGTTAAPTDLQEYWAYQILGFGPPVDEAAYRTVAQNESGIPAPNCAGLCASAIAGIGTGYWTPAPGDRAVIDGATFNNGAIGPGAVLYIDGDAELNRLNLDLRGGAIIVMHDLYLNDPGAGSAATLRLPPTAALEYPYAATNGFAWPCQNAANETCAPTDPHPAGAVQYRGFLWAKHNLLVEKPGWRLSGAVRVGDPSIGGSDAQLDATRGDLTVYYDDRVNRGIKTATVQLQCDRLTEVPAL